MIILLQGQLAVLAEQSSIHRDVGPHTTIADLIADISEQLPPQASTLLLNEDRTIRSSLFIAIDGQHFRDHSSIIPPNTQEIMLMPPMAGG